MDLKLYRIDHLTVGSTSPKTLKVLPNPQDKASTQKVAVADHNGILTCFQIRKNDISIDFKTLPGPKIDRLELGGALGSLMDKIFVASNSEVKGYSKRGKQFLVFDTNMSDNIKAMFVHGTDLHITGQYIYNRYDNCVDSIYYLSSDKINDMIGVPMSSGIMLPVMCCQDRVLRVLQGNELVYEAEVPGSPETLALYDIKSGFGHNNLLYGTRDGIVGLCTIGQDSPCHRWEIPNDTNIGGVTAIESYDLTRDGVSEVIVCRDDGNVEVMQPKTFGNFSDSSFSTLTH